MLEFYLNRVCWLQRSTELWHLIDRIRWTAMDFTSLLCDCRRPWATRQSSGRVPACDRWLSQYKALCTKHYLLAKRNWKTSVAQLGLGVIVCCLILFFQSIGNSVLNSEYPHIVSAKLARSRNPELLPAP